MDKNQKVVKVGDILTVRGDCFSPARESHLWYVLGKDESLPAAALHEEVVDFFADAVKQTPPPASAGRNSGVVVNRITFGF